MCIGLGSIETMLEIQAALINKNLEAKKDLAGRIIDIDDNSNIGRRALAGQSGRGDLSFKANMVNKFV